MLPLNVRSTLLRRSDKHASAQTDTHTHRRAYESSARSRIKPSVAAKQRADSVGYLRSYVKHSTVPTYLRLFFGNTRKKHTLSHIFGLFSKASGECISAVVNSFPVYHHFLLFKKDFSAFPFESSFLCLKRERKKERDIWLFPAKKCQWLPNLSSRV